MDKRVSYQQRRVHSPLPTHPSLVFLPHAAGTRGRSRRPYNHAPALSAVAPAEHRVHSPLPTPLSRVSSLPHAAAPAAGRDGMTPSARRVPTSRPGSRPGESCRYRDMDPRRRRLAARGCLAARGRPWGAAAIGRCRPAAGNESCRYRDMDPRRRRLAARGCLAARGRPWGAAAIGRCRPAAGNESCRYSDMDPRRRRLAARGCLAARGRPWAGRAPPPCTVVQPLPSQWLPHLVLLYSRCLVSAYSRRRIRIRKYVAGRRRRRARCGETEMSEGAGSNDARARISVPRAPGAAKEGAEAT